MATSRNKDRLNWSGDVQELPRILRTMVRDGLASESEIGVIAGVAAIGECCERMWSLVAMKGLSPKIDTPEIKDATLVMLASMIRVIAYVKPSREEARQFFLGLIESKMILADTRAALEVMLELDDLRRRYAHLAKPGSAG